jgi:hypothetical protein
METLLYDIVIHLIVAIAIAIPAGTIHEYLHRRKAKQLGYNVTKGERFKNETIVDVTDEEHIKKIARAPYIIIVPIALALFIMGLYLMHLGVLAGSGATLLMHMISYPLEGKKE